MHLVKHYDYGHYCVEQFLTLTHLKHFIKFVRYLAPAPTAFWDLYLHLGLYVKEELMVIKCDFCFDLVKATSNSKQN